MFIPTNPRSAMVNKHHVLEAADYGAYMTRGKNSLNISKGTDQTGVLTRKIAKKVSTITSTKKKAGFIKTAVRGLKVAIKRKGVSGVAKAAAKGTAKYAGKAIVGGALTGVAAEAGYAGGKAIMNKVGGEDKKSVKKYSNAIKANAKAVAENKYAREIRKRKANPKKYKYKGGA